MDAGKVREQDAVALQAILKNAGNEKTLSQLTPVHYSLKN
jgi:hypothetical protein